MRNQLARVSLMSFLVLLMAASGCVLDEPTDIVLTKKFCVNFDELQTGPTLRSEVVCSKYNEAIQRYLEEEGIRPEDVVSVGLVSGTYQVSRVGHRRGTKPHDWAIDGYVEIHRQDDPSGPIDAGPATFVNFTEQSLYDARSKPTPADLNGEGVKILDQALWDFVVEGKDPRIILTLVNSEVTPEPTDKDPLDFMWRACVTIQFVVRTEPSTPTDN